MSDSPSDTPRGLTPAALAVASWLHAKQTGCSFAAHIAAKEERFYALTILRDADAASLDALLDGAAEQSQAAFLVFPFVRSERQLVEQLNKLGKGERWRVRICEPPPLDSEDTFIGIDWRTRENLISRPMGLAPFPTMPVTRRAPHVALALWPGGRGNPQNKYAKEGYVDFLDAKHELDPKEYDARWKQSTAETARLLSEPPDDPKHYRNVAFRLSVEAKGLFVRP